MKLQGFPSLLDKEVRRIKGRKCRIPLYSGPVIKWCCVDRLMVKRLKRRISALKIYPIHSMVVRGYNNAIDDVLKEFARSKL